MIDDENPPPAVVKASSGVSPQTVAALRAILLAAASAAILAAIAAFSDLQGGQMATIAPIVVAVLRVLEGTVDKARGQFPQQTVAGSHPVLPPDASAP